MLQTLALRLFHISQPLWGAVAQAVNIVILIDVLHGGIHGRIEISFHLRHAHPLFQMIYFSRKHESKRLLSCGAKWTPRAKCAIL